MVDLHGRKFSALETPHSKSIFRCVVQRERSGHESGKPDDLPFKSAEQLERVFKAFDLPLSYLQIADGLVSSAQCHTEYSLDGKPLRMDFLVHCLNRQGHWAMALSYRAHTADTSVFWSLERSLESQHLVDNLESLSTLAEHPMLVPYIMFNNLLQMGLERRVSLKTNLKRLEAAMRSVNRGLTYSNHEQSRLGPGGEQQQEDIDALFGLLQICREEQASTQGRYHLWQSYCDSMEDGLKFSEDVMRSGCSTGFERAHQELKACTAMTRKKLESLQARDRDHVDRVGIASDMLYLIVQQQENRIQTDIAKASQLDSEDMKFIAVLGSVFLPANLIASILNIAEFQFLPGGKLFGFYIGITVPLIGCVVCFCAIWPRWSRWRGQKKVGHRGFMSGRKT